MPRSDRPPSTTRRAALSGALGVVLPVAGPSPRFGRPPSRTDRRPVESPTRTPGTDGSAEPPGIAWQSTPGGRGDQHLADVAPAHDGGWVLAGEDRGTDHTVSRPWLVSLADDGTIRWQRRLDVEPDGLHAVRRTDDGYLASGDDAWVAGLDPEGRVENSTSLGIDDPVRNTALAPIEGGYALAGIEPTPETATTVLSGLSPDLSTRWRRTYETEYEFRFLLPRGGDLLVGGWYLEEGGPWLARIGPDGMEQWSEVLDLPDWATPADAAIAGDGLTIAGGEGLVHLTADREVSWARRYDAFADAYPSALARTADGGYVLTGEVEESSLVRLAGAGPDGTLRWVATYGATPNRIDPGYEVRAISERAPGEYLLVGSQRKGATDGWVAGLSTSAPPPTPTAGGPADQPTTTGSTRDAAATTTRHPRTTTGPASSGETGTRPRESADPGGPETGPRTTPDTTVVDDQAGFGVVAALAGVLGGAAALARRRD